MKQSQPSHQEESVIRTHAVDTSAPAKSRRAERRRWRGWTTGLVALASAVGVAIVPTLGLSATPAGALPPGVIVVAGHNGATAPTPGAPVEASMAKINPTYVAYNPANGDEAVASTKAGSVYVYLIAGGAVGTTEANEYNIDTAIPAANGPLMAGNVYVMAGTGTAGLIAQPGNNQFGNSTSAVATSNPIEPTSVAFDPNGNVLIAGENLSTGNSAIQVVAKTSATFYGVPMVAGDLYTIGDVGLSGSPGTAINMGNLAAPANGMSVDATGNIAVGDGGGVMFVNEQSSPLSLYGLTIPAHSTAVVSGNAQGGTDCALGAASAPANSLYFQNAEPTFDGSDNLYYADNEPGPSSTGGGCAWVEPAQNGTLDGLSVTAGNVYKLAGNGGTTATGNGLPAVQSNVGGTSQLTLDGAGNLIIAVQSCALCGDSPAIQVLAESSGSYYGIAMNAGDLYTVAGGTSNLLATLSGPTSILNAGGGNVLFTDGASTSANLDELSGAPTGGAVAGGAITVTKTTALVGNYNEKVGGTGWQAHGDTSVTVAQCASTSYSASSCDTANQVSATLGTGTHAGIFSTFVKLATGTIDTNNDTCGLSGSPACYIVVTGNTGDTTASTALAFTLPSFTLKKTTGAVGNTADAVKALGIPIGDTVVAQECDASVSVPATISTHCDAATQISGTAAASGAVVFSPTGVTLKVGSAYSDGASGVCAFGGTCDIAITDSNNALFNDSISVGFATPTLSLKKTTAALGNSLDVVKAAGIPVGDSVVAQQCDASVTVPATVSTHCDGATQITGTAGATGVVVFAPTGVTLKVGSAYSDSASGTCAFGGTCDIAVTDSSNSAVGLSATVGFTTPVISVHKTTGVLGNYVNAVKAIGVPIGDTLTAQECDSSVVIPGTVGTHCDAATQISGTASTTGAVLWGTTGVTMLVGGAYSDSASGTCPVGGTCDIVVTDSGNTALTFEGAVTFATSTATAAKTTAVVANSVDTIAAKLFPVGDTVTAQECDSNVTAATVASHCDTSTVISGTAGATGAVVFSPTGVTIHVGGAFSDTAGGTVTAGGTADIVVTDTSHSGDYIAIPITLHT
jgi:hypothetical protein